MDTGRTGGVIGGSECVQVFGRWQDETLHARRRAASEKRRPKGGSTSRNKRTFGAMDLAHGTVNSIGKKAILQARQAEMFAQRRPLVVAPKQAPAL